MNQYNNLHIQVDYVANSNYYPITLSSITLSSASQFAFDKLFIKVSYLFIFFEMKEKSKMTSSVLGWVLMVKQLSY